MKNDILKNFSKFFNKKQNYLQNKRRRFKFSWKKLPIYGSYAVLGLIMITAISLAWFSKDLPTPSKIANRKPVTSTKLYDRTGQTLLYETGEQKRTIVQSDQISQYLKDATVSVEDTNFYNHHGIDSRAIVAAVGEKLLGKTRKTRGASTITQQYVKNALLSSNRSVVRKMKEAILAVELELMFKKNEILTMYLNEIPYGNNTAGAEAAAKMYYSKPAKDLTLAEAATLAAIPQAPTYYSPYGTHVDRLVIRRNYVLDQMVRNSKIKQEDADKAKKEDTTTVGTVVKPRRDSMLAPHFAMYVLEQLSAEFGEEKIQKEGLGIITTLDYDKQKSAEEAITTGVPKLTRYNASNAALVAIDPKTGQILSMVGSKDYFDTSIDGNVNVADSVRQPGSSFKPIAYATAFKKPEFSPSRILYDFQTDFGGGYVPQNYNGNFNGPVTMRFALANSLNIPAVKTMALAGMDNVLRTAEDLGITTLTQRDRYGLSLVLGAGEVKPVEMAGAFSVFATGGTKNETVAYLKVTDSSNKILYDYEKEKKTGRQVLDPQIAYEISNILSDNDTRSAIFGVRSALYFQNRVVAVKTGTTSDFKDAWTVGFTPSIAVAVWTGNSNGAKMKSGADGSVLAAPIFHAFIEKALANTNNEDFTKPDGIQTVTVEKYSNKLPGPYSGETTTDIFAGWQVPTEQDSIHQVVKICKGTNLLAPSDMPAEYTEERVITNIQSEKPDNPNWNIPVRAWAEANGMTGVTPNESCNASSFVPTIEITSPKDADTVSGNTSITASINSATSVKQVEFYIDDVSIGASNTTPYAMSYNFDTASNGTHKITIKITTENNLEATKSINVLVNKKAGPAISKIEAQNSKIGANAQSVITWITNEPATSTVAYREVGQSTYKSESNVNYLVSHSITLSNLKPNTVYYIIVSSKNNAGFQTEATETSFLSAP